ncbi:MAG: OB-fold nucleic acid binding domain-containing protein [Thermodesulfobacteriota bacterium]|nr:OB-fold nucleic acid binding domain-containing protein [Thermodesulfobacteriota bacterium]
MKEPATKNHESHLWIKDMKEDDHVHGLYLARVKKVGLTRKGDPFISITLTDRTGDVEARVWDRAEELSSLFSEGDILDVEGYASSYRQQIQVTLSKLKVATDNFDPTIFLETTTRDTTKMMRDLRAILKDIKNPSLKTLIESFLSDHHFNTLFKKAPAAKNFHHCYLGGLLEHTLSVCGMIKHAIGHYEDLEGDLLLTGAFLHDIGKIKEYKFNIHIDFTDEGRLLGHLVLGIAMLDEKLAGIKGFPQELAFRLKHLILSHHGQYEFGSPKRPKFLEAFVLHLIDDLDAKMNGVGRFMKRDRQDGAWTDFNRLFERYFLKGKISSVEEKMIIKTQEERKQKALF